MCIAINHLKQHSSILTWSIIKLSTKVHLFYGLFCSWLLTVFYRNTKSLKCRCLANYTTICNLGSFFSIMIWTYASEGLLRTDSNFFKNNLWKWIEPYSQDAPNIVLIGATNALPMAAPMLFAALLMTLPIGKKFILPTFHVHPRSWTSDSYFTCNNVKKKKIC